MRPYLRAANVTWAGLSLDDVKEMHFSESEAATFRLETGDILLSEASGSADEVGKPAIWQAEISDCCYQNTLLRVRSRHLVGRYLLWLFKWLALSGQFAQSSRGVGIHHLGAAKLSSWEVPIAPLREQERIVAAIEEQFSRLDAGVAALRRAKHGSRSMRAAVLQEAVQAKTHPDDADALAVDVLPDGWMWRPLGDLILSLRNGIFVSRPGTVPTGHPIYRISAVRPMVLNVSDVRYAPVDLPSEKVHSYMVEPGDLLFTRYSGNPELVGSCARVPPTGRGIMHPDKLIRVQVDPTVVESRFLEIAAATGLTRREVRRRVKTTAGQAGISGSDLRTVPFPIPPLEVQRAIIATVDQQLEAIDRLEDVLKLHEHQVGKLRSAILAMAFSGGLSSRDAQDEPASVLLERIAGGRTSTKLAARRRKPRTAKQSVQP